VPFFADGISGPEILRRQRETAERYGAHIVRGTASRLQQRNGAFFATVDADSGDKMDIGARRVLLATGAADIEPHLPNVPDAVQRGLVRYCPICDGYESRDRKIAVIGHGSGGLGDAAFVARTYSDDVTLLTLGNKLELSPQERSDADRYRIRIVEAPIASLETAGNRIVAMTTDGGHAMKFDVPYSALGLRYRTELALTLGAAHDPCGTLIVDDHCQTTVKGLYAAGAIVRGLDQIVIAMGHAAVAATAIHHRCEMATEDEK